MPQQLPQICTVIWSWIKGFITSRHYTMIRDLASNYKYVDRKRLQKAISSFLDINFIWSFSGIQQGCPSAGPAAASHGRRGRGGQGGQSQGKYCTVCPRSSDPFCIVSYIYKMGQYFLNIQYVPESLSNFHSILTISLYKNGQDFLETQ